MFINWIQLGIQLTILTCKVHELSTAMENSFASHLLINVAVPLTAPHEYNLQRDQESSVAELQQDP
jgi:hypothetical protein